MITFDARESLGYDNRAARLLGGLYRRISDEVDAAAAPAAYVLDIGTGPGRLLARLADQRPDLRLHGVDASPHMIALTERRTEAMAVESSVGDVAALPYPDDSFDLIVSSLSMHEWPDLDRAAAEIGRVLRPGGLALLYDFRFTRTGVARAALARNFGAVRRESVRLRWHPIALYEVLRAS